MSSKFMRIDALKPEKGWLVKYSQEIDGISLPVRETYCNASDLVGLPEDVTYGYEALEIALTKLLSKER
jgi:hypothetical protein